MNDLFTWAALGTIAGASAATLLATNVIGGLIGPSGDKLRKWIAIAIALLLSYLTAAFADDAGGEKSIIAFFNALVIFSAALGVNQFPPGNRQATHLRPRSRAVASPESSVPGSEGVVMVFGILSAAVQVSLRRPVRFPRRWPIGLMIGAVVGLLVGAVFGWAVRVRRGVRARTPAASSSSSSTTPGVCSTRSSAPST